MTTPSDQTRFDVVGIGNAIVDVIATSTDAELDDLGCAKGAMTLIDEDRAHELYDRMGPAIETSGGSAANTVVGLASFGARTAFVGRVRDDQLGEVFGHDIRAAGVHYATSAAMDGPATARCLILVTPDAQRTMSTFLGASTNLHADDIDDDVVGSSAVTYLEGYLWDPPEAKDAYRAAIDVARAHGRRVAFTLSDTFCVERHREEFLELLGGGVDIAFANEDEARALYGVDTVEEALRHLGDQVAVGVVTRGADGADVVTGDGVVHVDARPVERLVDTTGAGDLFAAGFLWGQVRGADAATCAELGALAAAEVIAHTGGRPAESLAELAAGAGLA